MIRLALLLTLLLAPSASAQIPCGVLEPCPTATPSPEPTVTATPTPTPVTPVKITLRRLPKILVTGTTLHVRGRITGIPPSANRSFELVSSTPAFPHRQLAADDVGVQPDGTFDVVVEHRVTTRYTVRARVFPNADVSGESATRTVRAVARYSVEGGFDQLRPVFFATFTVVVPKTLYFTDGKRSAGPAPGRAFFYAGRGRRLKRIASARFRDDHFDGEPETATLVASVHLADGRLPQGRFRYGACFRGRGARGLDKPFFRCGARYFRF